MAMTFLQSGRFLEVGKNFWPLLLAQKMAIIETQDFEIGVMRSADGKRTVLLNPRHPDSFRNFQVEKLLAQLSDVPSRQYFHVETTPFPVVQLFATKAVYGIHVKLEHKNFFFLIPLSARRVEDCDSKIMFFEDENCQPDEVKLPADTDSHQTVYRFEAGGMVRWCVAFLKAEANIFPLSDKLWVMEQHGVLQRINAIYA